MSSTITQILSLSILLPAVLSAARVRAADSAYLPFLLLLWTGSFNELLSILLINGRYYTAVNNNLYVLAESLLILWLYRRLATTLHKKNQFYWIAASFMAMWLFENFIFGSIYRVSSYFRIYYSFVVVLLSINSLNYLFFNVKQSLLRSPVFMITACFISFFTYKIIIEMFWLYGLNNSVDFRRRVYFILVLLNVLINFVFVFVVLWMPKKQRFILWS
jgi:hypothetical protein